MRLPSRTVRQCVLCTYQIPGCLARRSNIRVAPHYPARALNTAAKPHKKPVLRKVDSTARDGKAGSKQRQPTVDAANIQEDYFSQEHSSVRSKVTIGAFRRILMEEVGALRQLMLRSVSSLSRTPGKDRDTIFKNFKDFETAVLDSCTKAQMRQTSQRENPLFFRLRRAFLDGDKLVLNGELNNAYAQFTSKVDLSKIHKSSQQDLVDLSSPLDWYPATRAVQREVHLHIGPTNSGKTYHALKRLEEARTGLYAGPLRLLAHEVYSRFTAKGKLCALVTGEEQRVPEDMVNFLSSCTVEMVPLNVNLDVAVIDEIQMLADPDRGWAWTQAFLGVKAKEVHLCGEVRTKQLVENLCKMMGDKLIIHEYERLTPLKSMSVSLNGDLSKLKKGDAVILFSRYAIHAMKTRIEEATGKRCAVVYGSLPPETRAQQAALFNDPDNDYDFLVASDAVGMGLNLSIKRVVFTATSKFDGRSSRLMPASHIKQIAGRAGRYAAATDASQKTLVPASTPEERYKSRPPPSKNVGYVTTLEDFDLPVLRAALRAKVEPLKAAGILPPGPVIERFASYFPLGTPFNYILLRLHELANVNKSFFLCNLGGKTGIADTIQEFDLSVNERLTFLAAPIPLRDSGFVQIAQELAACVSSKSTNGHILDLKSFNLELLERNIDDHPEGVKGYLREAEVLHKAITLYMWLGYRFAGLFTSHNLALHLKSLTEVKIEECLSQFKFDETIFKFQELARKRQIEQELKKALRRKEWAKLDEQNPDAQGSLDAIEPDNEAQDMVDVDSVVDGTEPDNENQEMVDTDNLVNAIEPENDSQQEQDTQREQDLDAVVEKSVEPPSVSQQQ